VIISTGRILELAEVPRSKILPISLLHTNINRERLDESNVAFVQVTENHFLTPARLQEF
jgi:hypothetical protein